MTVGSLFSGIGGFDLGLERAGMDIRWQVERDPWCQKILAKHWPDVPRYGDVTTLTGDELEPVDLICGGFPCQPVSVAGQQKGTDDDRWLWPEFRRVVGLLGPRYVLVENVPGLFTANGGHAFGEILGDLADLGYDAEWTVLSAADVGAPHLRKRVWIVSHAKRGRCGTNGERRSMGQVEDRQTHDKRSSQEPDSLADAEVFPEWAGLRARRSGGERRRRSRDSSGTLADAQQPRESADRSVYQRGSLSPEEHARTSLPPRAEVAHSTHPESGRAYMADADRRVFDAPIGGEWEPEPDVGRVADGVPRRVDRLRGLGNAIVPQCAEWIGRQILA
jgi:DNA (cytosine-5)-methyltransferase 1